MNIEYLKDRNLFILNTPHSTYAMEVLPSGILTHVYWGPLLERTEDIPTGLEVRREINFGAFDRDEALQEYMPWGGYYFDENTLKAAFSDGVRGCAAAFPLPHHYRRQRQEHPFHRALR